MGRNASFLKAGPTHADKTLWNHHRLLERSMFIALAVTGLVVLTVLAVVAVRAHRYGGLRAAFSNELKEDRQALAAGRSRVATLTKTRERELRDARKAHEQATSAYDQRVARLQQRMALLEEPGMGRKLDSFKDVKVYEHSVKIGGRIMALQGAQARVETTPDSAILYVTHADGSTAFRRFDTGWKNDGGPTVYHGRDVSTVEQATKRDFSPEQIFALATYINNAIAAENTFRAELPGMRAATAAELQEAIADTGAVEASATERARVEAGTATVGELAAAQEALVGLEQRWAQASGTPAPQPALA